jgi:hypothetical protein
MQALGSSQGHWAARLSPLMEKKLNSALDKVPEKWHAMVA